LCAKKIILVPVNKNIKIHFTRLPKFLDKQKNLSDYAMRLKAISLENKYGTFDLILSNYGHRKLLFPKHIRDKLYYWIHIDPTIPLNNLAKNNPKKYNNTIKKHQKHYNNKNLIAVSKGTEIGILNSARVKPKSICTIYNPFDFDKIQNLSLQNNPNIPKENYIIHAARFDLPHKRQDILFAAFAKIKSNCKLVLLTEPCEELNKLIKQFKIQNKVIIAGFKNNPYPWFKNANLTVLCSDFEALPTVIIESLICGTPVVSTDCISGPNEILTGNMANWLVPTGDADALAKKNDQLLNNPEPINIDILEKFSANNILTQLINLNTKHQKSNITQTI
jgi:glycosyltransferase involved in cell wall biosynthesis